MAQQVRLIAIANLSNLPTSAWEESSDVKLKSVVQLLMDVFDHDRSLHVSDEDGSSVWVLPARSLRAVKVETREKPEDE